MNNATSDVRNNARRLLIYQAVLGLITALGFFAWKGSWEAVSALFGVLTSMASVMMLGSGVSKASAKALENPKHSMGILYFGAVKRFLLVVGFFVVGLGVLKLEALSMCVGFVLAQTGFLVNMRGLAKPVN